MKGLAQVLVFTMITLISLNSSGQVDAAKPKPLHSHNCTFQNSEKHKKFTIELVVFDDGSATITTADAQSKAVAIVTHSGVTFYTDDDSENSLLTPRVTMISILKENGLAVLTEHIFRNGDIMASSIEGQCKR